MVVVPAVPAVRPHVPSALIAAGQAVTEPWPLFLQRSLLQLVAQVCP